ncbi:MAG: aminoacyl-tRNA hydrolase, partial [Clostridiales bacterium]|nr:aminoacyl-tRNA hydrolase [Clostridiales bacterium]
NGEPVILAKPQTYMNHSGEAVGALLHFYKLPPSELIIVCDDISLPVGDIRVRAQGSAGGHTGLKSIISHLGTDVFTRVKIGVGDKPEGWDLADWVLSRFKKDETAAIEQSVERAGGAVLEILREGVAAVMNRYNKRIQNESL